MNLLLALTLLVQDDPVMREANKAAAKRGVEHLYAQVPKLVGGQDPDGADLVLWALLRTWLGDTPPPVQELIKDQLARRPTSTRSAALQALAMQSLDRNLFQHRIADCVQLVVDQQAEDGLWGAGGPGETLGLKPAPRTKRRPMEFAKSPDLPPPVWLQRLHPGPKTGDEENSRWAIRVLFVGSAARVHSPTETLQRAVEPWNTPSSDPATTILAHALVARDPRTWKADPPVTAAIGRLRAVALPDSPRLCFERDTALGIIDEPYDVMSQSWDAACARLRASQKDDGSWGDLESTAWAVMLLPTRAYAGLPRVWRRDDR